ncbi:ATP-binding protein [Streptomyces somaliensis DSM 40738]|uniref:ATP-binding protein n=1 Tax=Streptomyces somaliensis (strain ATCC 33201 / DSM 40738 / JCM 12659 / KCTC 9044 / NCTC 11332 / NRRL B-12077 / IP 733) TaxID=1134445 RepID=A0AA44IET5_STRE0|nr:ATP-binding protein [Streptomyces somaliensis]MCQ0023990.1 ATP-binding protein [Streptomyces somaliensis DSM 40738]NKY16104.1 ATP-binding protein [Streptomyces somaliensis DSM 40738]
MQQSAAKALGVVVFGAALAVSAAGSASAFTDLPTGEVVETATESVPVAQAASELSGGAGETATRAGDTLAEAAPAAPAAPADTSLDPVAKLLGGLPLGGLLPGLG